MRFGKNSHVREWDERERSLKQGMLGRDRQESDWERETFIGWGSLGGGSLGRVHTWEVTGGVIH